MEQGDFYRGIPVPLQNNSLEVNKMSVLQIRTEHITKDYPGTRALDDVSICFDSGRVHALVGKNGSGKSTLVKIFAGAIKPTSGEFYLNDEKLHFNSTSDAYEKGIVSVYQEMSLVPGLSVAENIFLGRLPKKNRSHRLAKDLSDGRRFCFNK